MNQPNALEPVLNPGQLYFTSRGVLCGNPLCCGTSRAYDGVDMDGNIVRCPYPNGICSSCGRRRQK